MGKYLTCFYFVSHRALYELPAHSHVEQVESDPVEAFAMCVGGQGWGATGSWILAAVPWQRDNKGLQGIWTRTPGDLLGMSVVILLVLCVNLSRLLIRLH